MLMIQSPSEAPVESYTLLGASASRDSNLSIGQFGSGSKLGIASLLREGLRVTVYCGIIKLEFGTRTTVFEGQDCECVTVSVNNSAFEDLGWTLDWGAKDWTGVNMGLRELVSNAIDASIKRDGFKEDFESGQLKIEVKYHAQAKKGFTRVYVDQIKAVDDFYRDLGKHFLHFTSTPLNQVLLPKANRDPGKGEGSVIYRMGVYVCTLPGVSVYDYNFGAGDIDIDESRNSNEYTIRATIAQYLRKATAEELVPIFKAIGERREVMEAKLDGYYLFPTYITPSEKQCEAWQNAWKITYSNAVLTAPQSSALSFVQRKGLRTQEVDSSAWRDVLGRMGIKTAEDVLTPAETKGCRVTGVASEMYGAFFEIWDTLYRFGVCEGKHIPKIGGFDLEEESDFTTDYYVDGNTVLISNTAGDRNLAIVQGIAQYVTGEGTGTYAFQQFAFAALMASMNI